MKLTTPIRCRNQECIDLYLCSPTSLNGVHHSIFTLYQQLEPIIRVDLSKTQTEQEDWQISSKICLRCSNNVIVEFRNINKHILKYTLPRGSCR
jgi:hypothetical protein